MRGGIDIGLERVGDTVPPPVQAMTGADIEAVWSDYIATVNIGPHTLLHGDAHIGNTYVLPDDTVGFLDWQVLRRGNQRPRPGLLPPGRRHRRGPPRVR